MSWPGHVLKPDPRVFNSCPDSDSVFYKTLQGEGGSRGAPKAPWDPTPVRTREALGNGRSSSSKFDESFPVWLLTVQTQVRNPLRES